MRALVDTELILAREGKQVAIPLHEIQQSIAPCGGMLGIWRCGEHVQPSGGIRPDSKNVPVLQALMQDWISVREENARSSTAMGVGRK